MSPSFQVLRIHEKEGQHVVFDEGNEEMATETQRDTELTKFFKLNEENRKAKEAELKYDPDLETLRYVDMPTKYTYNKKEKEWKPRDKNRKCDTLGRVDNVHPAAGDRFYLRLLLNSDQCKACESFEMLRTVPKDEYPKKKPCDSYQEACRELGLAALANLCSQSTSQHFQRARAHVHNAPRVSESTCCVNAASVSTALG